ncbi:hypothetical protein E2C01_010660 [Portunus trituberculatus]|uniref:Uncharacterized protein n=1 Tax=Portunus trituberculatus TaxID=210409 RepID=A0A5B7D916_PORTR|nr:hypothetical protein [Portunus trituberculatus]
MQRENRASQICGLSEQYQETPNVFRSFSYYTQLPDFTKSREFQRDGCQTVNTDEGSGDVTLENRYTAIDSRDAVKSVRKITHTLTQQPPGQDQSSIVVRQGDGLTDLPTPLITTTVFSTFLHIPPFYSYRLSSISGPLPTPPLHPAGLPGLELSLIHLCCSEGGAPLPVLNKTHSQLVIGVHYGSLELSEAAEPMSCLLRGDAQPIRRIFA